METKPLKNMAMVTKMIMIGFAIAFTVIALFVATVDDPMKDADTVVATVYNAVPSQCNDDPEHTAFMFKLDLKNPYKHKIIAVSRDLLKKYPKGTRVCVTGTSIYDGEYTVMDKMNKRWRNRIDILINEDMPIGKWRDVKIMKI